MKLFGKSKAKDKYLENNCDMIFEFAYRVIVFNALQKINS